MVGRQRATGFDELINAGSRAQETGQEWRAFPQNPSAARLDQGRVADELNRVAQALLMVKQNRLAFKRPAVPAWVILMAQGKAGLLAAKLIIGPRLEQFSR